MDYECWPLGDCALLLRFGVDIDATVNAAVHRAAAALAAAKLPGVEALAPSYAALALTLNPVSVQRAGGLEVLQQRVEQVLTNVASALPPQPRLVEIPTRYGGFDGPDLDEVAAQLGMPPSDLVELHAGADYCVAMLGFQPGFPYLLGLPPQLNLARRGSVRARVPPGSVAIAGAQTGIYPGVSPGGWHLIGRTELRLFDPHADSPAALLAGDRVRFLPVK